MRITARPQQDSAALERSGIAGRQLDRMLDGLLGPVSRGIQ